MDSTDNDQRDVIPVAHLEQLRDAKQIIRQEAEALKSVADNLNSAFTDAVQLIRSRNTGCVVVTGVGKAGLIGQKIVATLASTGTRARFLHPTEAVHGDLGCVSRDDVVLALSNSGASDEVLRLLPVLQRFEVPVIAITRDTANPLAAAAAVVIVLGKHKEAGKLNLAPTVSTTAMLAVGDALALTLSQALGFTREDFGAYHPAGSLGRRLCPVSEVMRSGDHLRMAHDSETVRQILIGLSLPGRRTGAVILTNDHGELSGIFTDSDLAKLFEKKCDHLIDGPVSEVMTANPLSVTTDILLPEAIQLMSHRKISELPVVDEHQVPIGLIDITDILDFAPGLSEFGAADTSPGSTKTAKSA